MPNYAYTFTHGGSLPAYYYDNQAGPRQYDEPDARDITCREWLSGACRLRYCCFTHDYRPFVSPPQPYTCWFWSMGRCTRTAETCSYTHSLDALNAQRPMRFGHSQPVIGGRNAAIARAAGEAGFDTSNWHALSNLLTAVKNANSHFELSRPRDQRVRIDSYRPDYSQSGGIRAHRDYYRPKRPVSPDGEEAMEYSLSLRDPKRRRTAMPQPELPSRAILQPRDPNAMHDALVIRTKKENARRPPATRISLIEKEKSLFESSTSKILGQAQKRFRTCSGSLLAEKAILARRWEADERLQEPKRVGMLESLAEGMQQALQGLEAAEKEVAKLMEGIE